MGRLNAFFIAIVVLSVLSGGVVASNFGADLRTIDTISVIKDQIESDITGITLGEERLVVTIQLRNPSGIPIELRGTFVRISQVGSIQLAYGAAVRLDGGQKRIPARGKLRARYALALSPEQTVRVREAMETGPVEVTVVHSMRLKDTSFEIVRKNVSVSGQVQN